MKKCILGIILLCIIANIYSCSNKDIDSSSDNINISTTESEIKELGIIVLNESLLNENNKNNYTLSINRSSNSVDTCIFTSSNQSCVFSLEKGEELFNLYKSFEVEEYEPYHSNSDGVMVTEYMPYTVQIFYSVGHVTNDNRVVYFGEDGYPSGHFCTLKKENYEELLLKFKEFEQIAEKSNNDQVQ